MANQTLSEPIQMELSGIRDFDVALLQRASVLDLDGSASWKTSVLGETLVDTIKHAAIRVGRRTLDSVAIQEIFDECTIARNDLHENRGFSPWQLLGKTPSDKLMCEKILILLSAVLKLWTRLQAVSLCEGRVVQSVTSRRSCHFENATKTSIKSDFRGTGQQAWCWRSGKHRFRNEGWCVLSFSPCVTSRNSNDR